MKELSIEDKAKAYDEALAKAVKIHRNYKGRVRAVDVVIEEVFPEFQENEDEMIRKALIKYYSFNKDGGSHALDNITPKQIITWLEKQGEQKHIDKVEPKFKVGDKIIEKDFNECSCGTIIDIKDGKYIFKDGSFLCIEEQGLWQLIEQNNSDKVESKFKVGDWVIDKQGIVHRIANVIENVTNHTYGYDIVGGGYFNDNVEGVRLWTIQDAKPGDVLACKSGWTCIFKTLNSDNMSFSSYCFMDNTGWFCETGSEGHTLKEEFVKAYNGKIYPATKEQRNLLFQRIHEAGYMWDSESKQLLSLKAKPIDEQKSVWSEEDDKILKSIIINIENLQFSEDMREKYHHIPNANKSYYQIKIDWLKSIKERVVPQQKQEWSEEDEKMFEHIIAKATLHFSSINYLDEEEINFLKSLRPQNTWKPSDEQMEALESATENCAYSEYQDCLRELIEQLKKLKG